MKKTIKFIVLASLCLNFRVQAQSDNVLQALKIGDQVPDLTIRNLINYSKPDVKLSDFKGKLLILDFWATWCAPCVSLIPRMDSLQTFFDGQVQFLPVAYQSQKEVLDFIHKYSDEKAFKFNMPQIVADTILSSLFPHRSLPHYVWIDETGTVVSITEYSEINKKVICNFLRDKLSPVNVKNEVDRHYDPYKPLFADELLGTTSKITSRLTGYVDGIGCGFYHNINNPNSHLKRITARNLTVPQLYQLAFGKGRVNIGFNRTVLNVKDVNSVINKSSGQRYGEWLKQDHGFCYELIVPDSLGDPFAIMLQDLKRAFPGYTAYFDDQEVEALVLRKKFEVDIKADTNEIPSAVFESTGCSLKNRPLNDLATYLDYHVMQSMHVPVINESGIAKNVDIQIDADLSDIPAVNREIEKYGLEFIRAKRKVKLLIFSETDFNNNSKI